MRNRYIVYLLILFVFFGFVSCSSKKHELAPKAVKGVLNLSEWDFNEQGAISLNGEWEFYWNQFVTPSQFKDSSRKEITSYFVLPKLWNGYKINNTELSGKGYATYRLKLKLKDIHQILAFKINRIETAYEFWINNKLLVKSGTIGKTEEEMTPCWLPTEVSWQPDSTEVELVILISNFKHRKGGSGQNIELGLPSQIYRSANKMLGIDVFLLGVLLIMAFYHFGLFFLRKKDRSNLYFGLVCIFTSFYMMANGEFLLSRIYPDVNWQMLVKINFISNILRITFFILFISDLFKEIVSRKFVMSFVIWGGAMTLFFLVTPAKIYTHSLILIILIAVAAIIYILFIQLKSLIAKRDGAGLSFIGTLVLLIAAVNDTLHDYSIIHTFYAVPFGVFIFIFFQSFMLSLRSSRLFAYVENLSNRLLVLDKIKNDFIAASTYDLGAPLKVIVENIGVERGVLILKDDSDWFIVSQAKAGINEKSEVFEDFYVKDILEEESMFSIDVFSDVIKSKESVIVADINADFNYRGTKYFLHRKVRSVFCMPLFDKEEMKGVLYLEHSQESNVFNDERINVLELLSSQLTTLVDNVRIYQELEVLNKSLEQKVRERTQEVYQQKEEIEAQRDEIDEKNQELSLAMEELSIKNKDMTDSIKYAKRIQNSILPSSDIIKKLLPQSFVLYKPKDILSGDFYWFDQVFSANEFGGIKTEKIIVAAVDCTGHGVPGALMSIIGNNLLNFAVNEMKKTNPAEILQIMHEGLKSKMLKQNEKITTVDGMDLALITYEPSTQTVMFSGARNPIFHVSNDQITEYKPNKFGIGDNFNLKVKTKVSFTSVEFTIKKGDALYLFSDGYTDQFGQIKRRKFMKPFFKRLLIAVQGQTMEEQHNALETTIDEWKGNTKQIDDILVIGIKF